MRNDRSALALAMSRVDIVSCDVFDTVLLRGPASERRRFALIASEASMRLARTGVSVAPVVLLRSRRDAQSCAYAAQRCAAPCGDVRLEDILRLQGALLCLSGECVAILHACELAIERRLLRANRPLLATLRTARAANKRIVAASDTWFSRMDLCDLLESVIGANPFDAIYSSSDLDATKKSGALFARLIAAERVDPDDILHLGDDRGADLAMAEAAGLQTSWRPVPAVVSLRRKIDAVLWRASNASADWRLA